MVSVSFFSLPFLSSLFFQKISDFFNFKTNNEFDFSFFFDKITFNFIIFNHVFNKIFFIKFLIALSQMKHLNINLFF